MPRVPGAPLLETPAVGLGGAARLEAHRPAQDGLGHPGLDRAQAHAQPLRDIAIGQAVEPGQQEGHPDLGPQAREHGVEPHHGIEDGQLLFGRRRQRLGQRRQGFTAGLLDELAPPVVDHQVPGDADQPGPGLGSLQGRLRPAQDLLEGALQQVRGIAAIAQAAAQPVVQPLVVVGVQPRDLALVLTGIGHGGWLRAVNE